MKTLIKMRYTFKIYKENLNKNEKIHAKLIRTLKTTLITMRVHARLIRFIKKEPIKTSGRCTEKHIA